MIPRFLLPQISPSACKTYLALRSHLDPRAPAPIVKLPMPDLMRLTGFSSRTCAATLRELFDRQLLRRVRGGFHQPRSYLFLPRPRDPANQQPAAGHTVPNQQPAAGHPNPSAQTPLTGLPPAPQHPLPRFKNPNQQPIAALLNTLANQQPLAGHHPTTANTKPHPVSLPKNPNQQPVATLLNTSPNQQPVADQDPFLELARVITLLENVEKLKQELTRRGFPPPPGSGLDSPQKSTTVP